MAGAVSDVATVVDADDGGIGHGGSVAAGEDVAVGAAVHLHVGLGHRRGGQGSVGDAYLLAVLVAYDFVSWMFGINIPCLARR